MSWIARMIGWLVGVRWLFAPLGILMGIGLAFLLPEYEVGQHDGPLAPRTYFFWDTMTRNWAAVFYALIGLGLGLTASLIARFRRS